MRPTALPFVLLLAAVPAWAQFPLPACNERLKAGPAINPYADTVRLRSYDGSYRLLLVATIGDSAGRSVAGTLRLASNRPSLFVTSATGVVKDWSRVPGTAVIDLGRVAALVGVQASDPAPDTLAVVLSMDYQDRPVLSFHNDSLEYRSLAWGRDTWLRLSGLPGRVIAGTWTSGSSTGDAAEGYLCLVRHEP